MNLIENDVDVERAWVATLSDEQINNPFYTTPLKDQHAIYGSVAKFMMNNAKFQKYDLIAEEFMHVYEERTQAKVQIQVGETLVDMMQLGNNALNGLN